MKKILLLFTFVIISCKLFSNGGPIMNSSVLHTGQICLTKQKDIKITNEIINIKFDGEYAIYDITYTLKEEYPYSVDTVQYGFPVDFIQKYYNNWNFDENDVPYFEMYLNNQQLAIKEQVDNSLLNDTLLFQIAPSLKRELYGFIDGYHNKRKWFLSQLIFDKNSSYKLNVKYKVHNYSMDFATSKSSFIEYGSRLLIYDFSPAGYWGDGIIDKISIKIDATNLDSNFETYKLKGLGNYVLKDGVYSFYQENFDPNKSKFLLVSYDYDAVGMTDDFGKNHILNKNIVKIKSSDKGNFDNLNDLDIGTFCTFKNSANKKGYIEYNFKRNTYFSCISILNGNYSSEQNYYDNGRLKKIKIEFDIQDWEDTLKIITHDTIITLEDRKYLPLSNLNFAHNCDLFNLIYKDQNGNIRRVKITFLETYKGLKNDDICISELLFNGFVGKIIW